MAEELHPIPIRLSQTPANHLKTFDAVAPAPGSAAELLALRKDCCKLINDIYTEGLPYVQNAYLSLQTLTTLKTHLNILAKRLNIVPTPIEPTSSYTTPRPPPPNDYSRQHTLLPTPPPSPPKDTARPVPNVQQPSRPSMPRRQTTGPYSKARQAYNNGMKSGILNLAEPSGVTYEPVNGWVITYGAKKQRNAPFKWFFHEADQRELAEWRKRFEHARDEDARNGGDYAKRLVGQAFYKAHPAIYHSGRYLRLGRYQDPSYPNKGYTLFA